MQLIFGARLPKLAAREATAFDQLVKAKACGCKSGAGCAANSNWASAPFVVTGPNLQGCSQVVLTSTR